jgi:dTDP-4-amino-4,6-dideoxygalactose transaminase
MVGDIPGEAWEYGLVDAIRGAAGVFRRARSGEGIDLLGLTDCLPVRSARAGIILAIKALGLKRGASVAVPLYCCPVVVKAVMYAGCRPTFIDIDPTNYCMSADDLSRKVASVDAAVIVHMFGHTANMEALRAALDGRPVIEDCAQALGSSSDGRAVGSSGDIAVFSFRSGKYISAGEGGFVHTASPKRRDELVSVLSTLGAPSLADECLHILTTYIRSKLRSKPLWGVVGKRLWAVYNARVDFTKKSAIAVTQPYASDLVVARYRLESLGRLVELQRANADHYLDSLTLRAGMCVLEPSGSYYNRYSFPIRCTTRTERDVLRAHLQRKRINASTPYCDLLAAAPRHFGYRGDCPESEDAFDCTVVIPSHYRLTYRERDRIVRSVNEAVSRAVPLAPAVAGTGASNSA